MPKIARKRDSNKKKEVTTWPQDRKAATAAAKKKNEEKSDTNKTKDVAPRPRNGTSASAAKKRPKNEKKPSDDESDFEVVPATSDVNFNANIESDDDSDFDAIEDYETLPNFSSALVPSSFSSIPDGFGAANDDFGFNNADEDAKLMAQQVQAANRKKKKSGGFQSMGLSYPVYKAIIGKGYKVPTPIQRRCIPIALEGNDLVGMARTGSGKTAAFMIPMIEKLKAHSAKVGVRGIVLSPSRELAMQTHKFAKEMTKHTDLRSCVLVGGDSLDDQFAMIASNPDILIATPGRFMHLIIEMELDLKTVEVIVFDEADRLFEMGFAVQLHEILHKLPPSRQTMLFSATLPSLLVDFAKAGLQDPTLIRLDVDTKISKDLEMAFFTVKKDEKEASLLTLLRDVLKVPKIPAVIRNPIDCDTDGKKKKSKRKPTASDIDGSDHQTIVFVSTKHHVEYIGSMLELAGYHCSMIYGAMDQTARKIHITNFREGRTNVLVVTDVAARGIDIPILENVINYDFVDSSKVFVHRVGRAARAGRRGWAYSILTVEELPYLVDLQLFLGRPLVLGRTSKTPSYISDISVGSLPRDILQLDIEWVKESLDSIHDLDALRTVAANGRKLYCKSRPSAAPESYKRAKGLTQEKGLWEIHPLFDTPDTSKELERNDFLASISNFRPAETVFEFGSRGAKKASVASTIMKTRRATVGGFIEATKTQKRMNASETRDSKSVVSEKGDNDDVAENEEEEQPKSQMEEAGVEEIEAAFVNGPALARKRKMQSEEEVTFPKKQKSSRNYRDDEFYMSYYQEGANTEKGYSMTQTGSFLEQAQNAQLDLLGDERTSRAPGGGNSTSKIRWDAKKKKYVRGDGTGSDNKKLIRTESGAKVSASYKSGRFQEWQSRTRTSMPRTGEMEAPISAFNKKKYRHKSEATARPLDPLRTDYERKKRRLDKKTAESGEKMDASSSGRRGGKNVRSELKTVGQIAKERMEKEKRRAKTGRHSKTGGRGGRGGGKGRGGGRR